MSRDEAARQAYDEGYNASRDGKRMSECPYVPVDGRCGHWQDGYLYGETFSTDDGHACELHSIPNAECSDCYPDIDLELANGYPDEDEDFT